MSAKFKIEKKKRNGEKFDFVMEGKGEGYSRGLWCWLVHHRTAIAIRKHKERDMTK